MKRYLLAAALAVLPSVAQAGMGFTWYTGVNGSGAKGFFASPTVLPTLDIHNEKWTYQLHALDLVRGLVAEQLYLAGDVFMTTRRMKVNEDIGGVIQPGGSLDIATNFDFEPVNLGLQGKVRMGAQTQKGMGFGVYVVPGVGVGMASQEIDFLFSGTLEVSVWSNK